MDDNDLNMDNDNENENEADSIVSYHIVSYRCAMHPSPERTSAPFDS
jgi:hypothetical protein